MKKVIKSVTAQFCLEWKTYKKGISVNIKGS